MRDGGFPHGTTQKDVDDAIEYEDIECRICGDVDKLDQYGICGTCREEEQAEIEREGARQEWLRDQAEGR